MDRFPAVKKYIAVIVHSYKRTLTRRLEIVVANLQSVFTLFILFHFWKFVYGHNDIINGYTFAQIITYYFLVRVTYNRVSRFGANTLAKEIKTGEITKMLMKPLDFITYTIFDQSIAANFWTIGNLLSILLFSGYLYKFLVLPSSMSAGAFFVVAFLINGVLSVLINTIIGTIGFWTTEITHIKLIATQLTSLLAGGLIPFSYYPQWTQDILNLLPFRYLVQFPVDIYLGKLTSGEILSGFLGLTVWTTILWILSRRFFNLGLKTYESFG